VSGAFLIRASPSLRSPPAAIAAPPSKRGRKIKGQKIEKRLILIFNGFSPFLKGEREAQGACFFVVV
jgi:hypothetical protein